MKLKFDSRLMITLSPEDKAKIEQAAMISGKTMSAYAREILAKNAEIALKKPSKKRMV